MGFINRSRLRQLYLWNPSSETVARIEECLVDAGITHFIWSDHKNPKKGLPIRQLAFVEDIQHDEERLQRDLDLLRSPQPDYG